MWLLASRGDPEHRGTTRRYALGALLTVVALWWMYFTQPTEEVVDHARHSFEDDDGPNNEPFIWGYGHFFIFGAAAAVGAGYAVAVDAAVHAAHLSARGVSLSVAVPVALYVIGVWALHAKRWAGEPVKAFAPLALAALILVAGLAALPVLVTGVLSVLGITYFEVQRRIAASAPA
jgi:low temperature requirement protein LtrA